MRFFLILALLCLPHLARAQMAATLVADQVVLNGNDQLIASGNIEVLYDGTRLTATQIIYDSKNDRLTISGPIFIQTADCTILTADRASLDPKLENGLLMSARLVLDQQLQLAANRIDRQAGRYSQLYKVAATSCQVCGNRPPLWDIRAETVVHDEQEQQLYFTNATFRLRGVPVLWLPRMRLPDPTLKRATGLLIPQLRTTDQLGTGLKLPYFVTLGDHRDLTLTPYVSPETKTLELLFRQAFAAGDLTIRAAASRDTLLPDQDRSYLFADGQFALGGGYRLDFDIEAVSDPAYLIDYGYADKDRLDSAFEVTRVRADDLTQIGLTYYQTLRDDEKNATLPPIVGDLRYERLFYPAIGGTLTVGVSADTAVRYGEATGETGRDVSRLGLAADWRRTDIIANGMVVQSTFGLSADAYHINDDPGYDSSQSRVIPSAGVTLRWPLIRQGNHGVTHLLEPTVALAWSDAFGDTPPNEDSTRAELDQANLFDLSRLPGDDAVETGMRAAFGLTWTRAAADGATTTLTFGRVVREDALTAFSPSSGLDGRRSDWLLAWQINTPDGLHFDARSLFDDQFFLTRAAARVSWQRTDFSLGAAYIWQAADSTEARPTAVSEWKVDTTWQIDPSWGVNLDARYDVAADRFARAGGEVSWKNECVAIDLSVSRRFTSSTTVDPSTDYGLSVTLNGFSTGRTATGPAARCSN